MRRRIDRAFLVVPLIIATGFLVVAGTDSIFDGKPIGVLLALAVAFPVAFILGTWAGQGER